MFQIIFSLEKLKDFTNNMNCTILTESIPNSSRIRFSITENDQIISFLNCCPGKEYNIWHIMELYTEKNHRGKGYATQILDYAIQYLKDQHDISEITLTATPDSESGITHEQLMEFYQKHGFEYIPNTSYHMHLLIP